MMNNVSRLAVMALLLGSAGLAHAQSTPAPGTDPAVPQSTRTPTPTPTTVPTAEPPAQATVVPGTQTTQSTPDGPEGPVFTIKRRTNLVNLVFTVTDKHGHFVTGLQRQSFGLLDDGYPPEAVLGFTQLTNLPLRVGVMLDTSSSIRSRFKFEQDAAVDFFLQVLHPADRAFVQGFDKDVYMPQDYTANVDLLDTGIRKLRPGGATALYDALYKTCQSQMLTLKDDQPVRKALIVVSDGDDDYSRATMTDAIKMCQRAETIVYTISTDMSPTPGKGDEVLKAISVATGGQPFFPNRLEDVAVGFKNIEEELRSQYSLEYRPAAFKQDGSFRTIRLVAMDGRYNVRSRTGYFAPRAGQ